MISPARQTGRRHDDTVRPADDAEGSKRLP
jgi:hypothetical protein